MTRPLLVWALLCLLAMPLYADTRLYELHNHPNNVEGPPLYGLRLDDLLEVGIYTFDFDYSDSSGSASMSMTWDDKASTIHIWGRAYGGRDVGGTYDAAQRGWVDIDFTYRAFILRADNRLGDYGDDLFVLDHDDKNNGFIELLDWGGDQTFDLTDKSNSVDTFEFDNDWDHKWNASFANNPLIWSGSGWLTGAGAGVRDWSFWAEEIIGVPVDQTSWSAVKRIYSR